MGEAAVERRRSRHLLPILANLGILGLAVVYGAVLLLALPFVWLYTTIFQR